MNAHERFRQQFDDHLEGTLPAAEASALERHLESCRDCAAEFASLRRLLATARELPREHPPAPRVWAQVEATIAGGEAAPGQALRLGLRWALGAATLAAAAVLWVVLTPERPSGTARNDTRSAEPIASESVAPLFVTSLVRGLELECEGAGRELKARSYAARADGPAGVATAIAPEVRLLDDAIAETRAALARTPADPALLQTLTTRYEQKLLLLHRALRWSAEA
jgi:anti-sigma factor RsiW